MNKGFFEKLQDCDSVMEIADLIDEYGYTNIKHSKPWKYAVYYNGQVNENLRYTKDTVEELIKGELS